MTTKVKFKLPAENVADASEGILLGEFNNWNHEEAVQLVKEEDGSMFAEIALTAGRSYQYRYFLNDGRWVNDHNSTATTDVYGHSVENCIVEVPVVEKKKSAPKAVPAKKATEVKVAEKVKTTKEAKVVKAPKAVKEAKAVKVKTEVVKVKEVKAGKESKKKK